MTTGKPISVSTHPLTWSHFDLNDMYWKIVNIYGLRFFSEHLIGSLNQHMLSCFINIMNVFDGRRVKNDNR